MILAGHLISVFLAVALVWATLSIRPERGSAPSKKSTNGLDSSIFVYDNHQEQKEEHHDPSAARAHHRPGSR